MGWIDSVYMDLFHWAMDHVESLIAIVVIGSEG